MYGRFSPSGDQSVSRVFVERLYQRQNDSQASQALHTKTQKKYIMPSCVVSSKRPDMLLLGRCRNVVPPPCPLPFQMPMGRRRTRPCPLPNALPGMRCDAMQVKTFPFLPQKEIPHGPLDGKTSCAILGAESSCEAAPLPAASKHVPTVPVVQTA